MGYLHPLDCFIGHGGKSRCGLKKPENAVSITKIHPSFPCVHFVQQQLSLNTRLRHNRELNNTVEKQSFCDSVKSGTNLPTFKNDYTRVTLPISLTS
jgi:hypothetical protein